MSDLAKRINDWKPFHDVVDRGALYAKMDADSKPDRPGWIYVVSSPDMPGLLKIGLTTVNVAERVKSMSAHSAVPRPLVCEQSFPSEAVDFDEWSIHKLLKPCCHGKEWFRIDLADAVAACRKVVEPPEPVSTSYDNLMKVIHG